MLAASLMDLTACQFVCFFPAVPLALASISTVALQKVQKIMLHYLIKVISHCFVFISASKAISIPTFYKSTVQLCFHSSENIREVLNLIKHLN